MQSYSTENLKITEENGVIDSIFVKDQLFNGFPGRFQCSPGIKHSVAWSAEKDYLICDITLNRVSGDPAEGAFWKMRIPYAQNQASLNVWTAREGYPKGLYDIGGTKIVYGDVCYGNVIPMVSLYSARQKTGLTVAKVPGRTGGRFSFYFDDYHMEGMDVTLEYLNVQPEKPVTCRLLFFAHGPCWRPGVKKYIELYPEYFEPVNKDVAKMRAFVMSTPFFSRETTMNLDCDWAEIHNHFPYYGNYLCEDESWQSVVQRDYPDDVVGQDLTVTREKVRSHIKDLKDAGIKSLYYVQCGGDAWIPWIEETFPESIARDSAGHNYPTWINCCFANGTDTPFGEYLDKQLDSVFDVYPELDGLFVDQLCYQTFDYTKSDGRTAVNGKYVFEYGTSLEKKFRKLTEKAHAMNKLILVNGPFDMDISKGADGIMSEGASSIFDTYRYLCVRRPMLVHEFPVSAYHVECMLRSCLIAAAGWSIGGTPAQEQPKVWTPEITELYRKYLPLIKAVFGAELLLEENPVSCEPAPLAKVEIFKSRENDDYFVPVLSNAGYLNTACEVMVNLLDAEIKTAQVMYLGKEDWEDISFETKDGKLVFRLPNGYSACLLKLSK